MRYLFLLLLSLFSLALKAQVGEPRNQFSLGVAIGYTSNKIDFDPSIRQKRLGAPAIGVVFRYTSEKYFNTLCAFQAELNYATLGWKEDIVNVAGNPLPDTYQRNLHYLQLPILARLGWGKEQKGWQFYFLAGPQVEYCFHESSERGGNWTLNQQGKPDRPNNLYEQYEMPLKNKFDYGITAGIGVELNSSIGHFLLEGRYYYGLGDIFGNAKRDVFARSAHGTISVKATYLFDL